MERLVRRSRFVKKKKRMENLLFISCKAIKAFRERAKMPSVPVYYRVLQFSINCRLAIIRISAWARSAYSSTSLDSKSIIRKV